MNNLTEELKAELERAVESFLRNREDGKIGHYETMQFIQSDLVKRIHTQGYINWYKKEDVYNYLRTANYSEVIANELSEMWAQDLQASFQKGCDKGREGYISIEESEREKIEFAKMHVKAALEKTSKCKPVAYEIEFPCYEKSVTYRVDKLKEDILASYPMTKIKP